MLTPGHPAPLTSARGAPAAPKGAAPQRRRGAVGVGALGDDPMFFFWFSGIRGYHGIFKGIDGIYIMGLLMGNIYIYTDTQNIYIYT